MANPLIAIQDFFNDYHLIEVRKHLHGLLEVAITSSNDLYTEPFERDAVVCFIKKLEMKMEATYQISNK